MNPHTVSGTAVGSLQSSQERWRRCRRSCATTARARQRRPTTTSTTNVPCAAPTTPACSDCPLCPTPSCHLRFHPRSPSWADAATNSLCQLVASFVYYMASCSSTSLLCGELPSFYHLYQICVTSWQLHARTLWPGVSSFPVLCGQLSALADACRGRRADELRLPACAYARHLQVHSREMSVVAILRPPCSLSVVAIFIGPRFWPPVPQECCAVVLGEQPPDKDFEQFCF